MTRLFLQALSAHAHRCGVHVGERYRRGSAEGTEGCQRANGRGAKSSEVLSEEKFPMSHKSLNISFLFAKKAQWSSYIVN